MRHNLWRWFLTACLLSPGLASGQEPGTLRWAIDLGGEVQSSPAIAPDGTIYVGCNGSGERGIYSISGIGATNWVFRTRPYGFYSSPLISPQGIIYAVCEDGKCWALNPDGTTNRLFMPRDVRGAPAFAADGTIYVRSTFRSSFFPYDIYNRLYALHPNGTTNWICELGKQMADPASFLASSPAVGTDGTIYIASTDQNLYAITLSGKTNWIFYLGTTTAASPAIAADGAVYIGTENGNVYAIDRQGHRRWTFPAQGIVESSAALDVEGNVYVGSLTASSGLYAIDPLGNRKWSAPQGVVSSSPCVAADGTIYFTTVTSPSKLVAVSPSGTPLWSYPLPDFSFSSPVLGPDGTIYFGAGRKLYAVYGATPLMNSAWPMFRRSSDHTARAVQRGLQNPTRMSDGNFGATLTVEIDRTYRIEASADLANWEEIISFVSDTSTVPIVDLSATNFPHRFYRLVTVE